MKAAELKQKAERHGIKKEKGKYIQIIGKYVFTPDEMQSFIDQVCKEQRRKCMILSHHSTEYDVDNAPKPDGL